MKKYLFIALLFGCTIPVVIAQQNNNKNKRVTSEIKVDDYSQRKANVLKEELQLSDAQTLKIKDVYKKHAPIRLGMQAPEGMTISQMNEVENKEIEQVLTPDQKVRFTQRNNAILEQRQISKDRVNRSRESVDEVRTDLKHDLEKTK